MNGFQRTLTFCCGISCSRKSRFAIVWDVRFAVMLGMVLVCGCERSPEYSISEQRPVFQATAMPAARVLNMDDPGVTARFVRDISPELSSSWRWGFKRPAVRIKVRKTEGLKYTIDFTLPEVTFKDTGPVTIAFTVNDHVLGRVRYESAGAQHFERNVPADWVTAGEDAIVGAEIDRLWISKGDGASFGFIISRIGLARE